MKPILPTLALIAVIALSGCAPTVVTEGTHPPVLIPGENTNVRLNNVSLTDDALAGKVAIQGSGWQETDTGTAQVWVQIRNRTDYYLQLQCRTQFYDAQKAPLGQPSAWQRVMASPNAITTYRENSTHQGPGYYYVEIREGR